MNDSTETASVAAIRERMPTVKEMQVNAEDVMRRVLAGHSTDDVVIRAQARLVVRAIRPRVREVWRG